MMKMLQSVWMTALIGAVTFILTLVMFWKQVPPPEPVEAVEAEEEPGGSGFTLAYSDVDQLIRDLQQQRLELDQRQQRLDEWEARLKSEASELEHMKGEMQQMMEDFDAVIPRLKEEEVTNLKKLAKVYSAMTPQNAADILAELDDEGIVKILVFMKDEETARILEALAQQGGNDTKRVSDLSEKLRISALRQPLAKE